MKPILLATKLHPPAALPKGVSRPRLVQHLNQGLAAGRQITLVSAPAGFGKSTCIREWISQLDLPFAWLSLDPADDDPARFLSYFGAALQKLDRALGRELDRVLETGQIPPSESICTALLDEILRFNRRFLLVLDDFQVIQDRAILDLLEMLIANLPPQPHLVLITREDPLIPLARLRANNQVNEIRAENLRFTGAEAESFFTQTMGQALSADDFRILENRIEGWVAGLQLVGLSIYGRANPSTFIANLSGTQRHILSYLTEEVLNRQSADLQDFLIQTSTLDKMSGELCDAVLARTGSGSLLERLFSANLFLVALDDEQKWFRYHHLFADLLRSQQSRLPKAQISRLHHRASEWFTAAGMPGEAIQHALAGEDYARAVSLLEEHAMGFAMQGHVKTVEGWLRAIPPALHSQSPRAYLAFASVYLMRGNYAEVAKNLSLAEAAIFQPQPAQSREVTAAGLLQAEWFAIQANLLNVQGKPADSLAAASRSLLLAPPEHFNTRAIAFLGMGGAYRLSGEYPRLVESYQNALQNSRAAGNSLAEMLSSTALALAAIQHGQLRFAHQVGTDAVIRFERSEALPPPVAGSVYGVLGLVAFEWNQLETARQHFTRSLQLSTLGGHNAGVIFAKVLQARLAQAEGDLPEAARLTHEAVHLLSFGAPAWLKPEVAAQQVRVYLAQNNLVSAAVALQQFPGSLLEPEKIPGEVIFIAHLRLILHHFQAGFYPLDPQVPARLAGQWVEDAIRSQLLGLALEMILLQAQIQSVLGNKEAARQALARAVRLAEPEGYARIFIDGGPGLSGLLKAGQEQNLLAEAARPLPAGAPGRSDPRPALEQAGLVEPLSDRELEVLKLTAEGLTNLEIATRLVIALSTVKTHLVHIYAKLNARNRTEALLLAKNLGLL